MSDTLGHFCEAVMIAALDGLDLSWKHHDTTGPQALINCLDNCSHGHLCKNEGRLPRLRVEPDFVISCNRTIFVYVTHAESSNIYNFKLWRTLGEILEQRKFIESCVCADILFGALREKKEVYQGFELISDLSDRIGVPDTFREAVAEFQREYKGPTSVPIITDWIKQNAGDFVGRLVIETRNILSGFSSRAMNAPKHPTQALFRDICRHAHWKPGISGRPIGDNLRTGMILSTVLRLSLPDRKSFTNVLSGKALGLALDPGPYYRKRGAKFLPAWKHVEDIDGDYMDLAPEIRQAVSYFPKIDGFLAMVDLYSERLRKDSTWSFYLNNIASWSDCKKLARVLSDHWPRLEHCYEFLLGSVCGSEPAGALEMVATIMRVSMNRLAQSLEDQMSESFGFSLKRFAPHGDDAIHVLSHLNRGNASALNYRDMNRTEFLDWFLRALRSRWDQALLEQDKPPKETELVSAYRYRLLKTFLTRAPSPLLLSVLEISDKILLPRGYKRIDNALTPTFLNDILGGKILRAGAAFAYETGSRRISFMVSSTSEGNDKHKMKEYAGKVVAKKIQAARVSVGDAILTQRPGERIIVILDGSWPPDAQRFLYESGADFVATIGDFSHLEGYLSNEVYAS